MKVIVDQDNCASSGNWVMQVPEIVDQRDVDGAVVLLNENPAVEQGDNAQAAARSCPR